MLLYKKTLLFILVTSSLLFARDLLKHTPATAPLISRCVWGEIDITHPDGTMTYYSDPHKDAKIWPTGSCVWNWKETGTSHTRGIQIADTNEILPHADIIILTRGVDGVLHVPQTTIDYVKAQGKEVIVELTPVAVEAYNRLVKEGKKVAGLFHSTC